MTTPRLTARRRWCALMAACCLPLSSSWSYQLADKNQLADKRLSLPAVGRSVSCRAPKQSLSSRRSTSLVERCAQLDSSDVNGYATTTDGFRSRVSGIVKIGPAKQDPLAEIERLKQENRGLRQKVKGLEADVDRLEYESYNRIVLENFEGEGRFGPRRIWDRHVDDDEGMTLTGEEKLITQEDFALWCDSLEDDACPVEPTISFSEALRDRAYWLVGLLVLQSLSGVILSRNQALLANHPVIVYFLTMLVGAGGNAGNQASVRVIRGLALGTLNEQTQMQFIRREIRMALSLSAILSTAGFLRAAAFRTPLPETIAITSALALIVFSSVCLGAVLPLLLKKLGVDPAHSSTTIQVIMDILGVILAVVVSSALLDSPVGKALVAKLSFG